jgi:hypothetical protein
MIAAIRALKSSVDSTGRFMCLRAKKLGDTLTLGLGRRSTEDYRDY